MGHTKTSERKKDHIDLAFKSVVNTQDERFFYEPLFAEHPDQIDLSKPFLGKQLKVPVWVSSMTGGTKEAGTINKNLARACGEFGMGMGLGSCRIILDNDEYLSDFQLRSLIGDYPLYANLGIAQVEELIAQNQLNHVSELLKKTETDGLIVHINPLQEWLQPEGDRLKQPPIDTISRLLDMDLSIVVKEVGQGFGPESLRALMNLPLAAIDFGAHGGTNFSKLEMHRSEDMEHEAYNKIANWGHTAEEMVSFYNELLDHGGKAGEVIVSGGVRDFMDGYYHIKKIKTNAVYGQASSFLKHSRGNYEDLRKYVDLQIRGLKLANTYLKLR